VRTERQRRFRSARRHSHAVRMLRIGLPVIVVIGGLGGYAAVKLLDPLRALARLPIDLQGVVISGSKIAMQAPRLDGYTQDKRHYTVVAKEAAQDITKPDLLELTAVHATVETADRGKFEVTGRDGLYDSKGEQLTLRNDILVVSQNYEVRLTEAVYSVRAGSIVSEKPVEVKMLQGTVKANRLEVVNSGEVIRFGGGVVLEMTETENASQGR
jgi:lipopolysaccharide export system protein LptC